MQDKLLRPIVGSDGSCDRAYFESWGSSVAWRWFLRMWPMSWWRWTCSERGACSFNLPRPSSLWAEETLFLPVYTFFWGLFSYPTLFAALGQQPICPWFPFSAEQYTFSFSFWAYGFICGWPRPVSSRSAKQPGWKSPPIVTIVTIVIQNKPGQSAANNQESKPQ